MEETQQSGAPGSAPEPLDDQAPLRPRKRSRPRELFETLFIALLLALLIRATLAEARFIPSGSMIPTLLIGDRLLVEKLSYYFRSPQRGDIVVFYPPQPYQLTPLAGRDRFLRWLGFTRESAFIKRVVGLPGETIALRQGHVLINGKELAEPYVKDPSHDDMEPQMIPADNYFMMGDNRNNSRDSRFWGTMPGPNVIGKTFVRFWPAARFGAP